MKNTQFRDSIRNIMKQFVSYLSIVIIAFLAVMAYLGINYAAQSIAHNTSDFYNSNNFRDSEIISTLLLTEDDLDAIRSVDGVKQGRSYDLPCLFLSDQFGSLEKRYY